MSESDGGAMEFLFRLGFAFDESERDRVSAYSLERPFTSEGNMVRCNIILDKCHHNYMIATAFTFTSVNIMDRCKTLCLCIFYYW
jgi:hypothetical protein